MRFIHLNRYLALDLALAILQAAAAKKRRFSQLVLPCIYYLRAVNSVVLEIIPEYGRAAVVIDKFRQVCGGSK
jgi:hypothetical protein